MVYKLMKKLEGAILAKMKDHALVHGHAHKHTPHLARQHASHAVAEMAEHLAGCGLVHPHLVHLAHQKAHKYIHGKGFLDSLKSIGNKILSGAKTAYEYAKPFIAPVLKAVTPMATDWLKSKNPMLGELAETGSNMLQEHLAGEQAGQAGAGMLGAGHHIGHGTIGVGWGMSPPPSSHKNHKGGFLGLGKKHSQKGSHAMKLKMAKVRASKSGGAMYPAGSGMLGAGTIGIGW